MDSFLQGAISTAFIIAGIFFLRYWKQTRDRLFLLFALAFGILGLNRGLLVAFSQAHEDDSYLYLIRLFAFLIIIAAIVDKNLQRNPRVKSDLIDH
ncbi:DUF5985 family protein [Brevifollis gellanilyticus]|uniref:Uncharacterized protein n=1 Tax=Brevifollis gellanilyticus TaxID=748831 RepID=A0A512MEC6_9BACT|nr:DUF5985 family protein [Brevifollis gellanilyticus]GEP45090.1 hypothetical protein BGE01nite_43810 [Brevifollis gellanilyticus]